MTKKYLSLLLLCFVFAGCNKVAQVTEIVTGPAELTEEEKAQRNDQIKQTDVIVQEWTDRLADLKYKDESYIQHEGITEEDAWGNFLKVQYQDGPKTQVLIVSSSGADGKFDTSDDIVRQRTTNKKLDPVTAFMVFMEPHWGWVIAWVIVGAFVGLLFLPVQSTRRRKQKDTMNGFVVFFGSILFAPFALLALVVAGLGEMGDGGIDIDLDIDL
jgi:hypothetical protein